MVAHDFDFEDNYKEAVKALKIVTGGVHSEEDLEQESLQERRRKVGSSV